MYWADIGTSVASMYAVTYEYNEIYRRPIFPLGQLWNSGRGMSLSTIEQFNQLAYHLRSLRSQLVGLAVRAALLLGRHHPEGPRCWSPTA